VPVENTFYYGYVTTPDSTDLTDLLQDLATVIGSDWLPLLPANVAITSLYARDLEIEAAVQAEEFLVGAVGTASGAGLPTYVTLAVARKTALTGRSTRGRIFWIALTEEQVTNSTVDGGVMADIVDAVEAFDAAAALLGYSPVIVSRYNNGLKRATGVTYPITTWAANDGLVDTRRSRKEG